MILKAILLGLVAMLGHTNFLFGTNLLDRPLIMCTLTGLVMGDLKSGIIIGAMMELAFIGAFSVGASLPPDMISGGVLGHLQQEMILRLHLQLAYLLLH